MHTIDTRIPFLSIIIPAYNEQDRIIQTVEQVISFIQTKNLIAEIIVVDDGSTDATVSRIKEHFGSFPFLNIHSLSKNKGKGFAVKTGILQSKGQCILFMDADSSTPITEFSKLAPYLSTHDVVIGSRIRNEGSDKPIKKPFYRKIITSIGKTVIKRLLVKNIQDTQCGFKLFHHQSAKNLALKQTIDRFGFDVEMLLNARRLGYTIAEVPVVWQHSSGSRFHPFWDTLRTAYEILKIKIRG